MKDTPKYRMNRLRNTLSVPLLGPGIQVSEDFMQDLVHTYGREGLDYFVKLLSEQVFRKYGDTAKTLEQICEE